MCPLLIPALIVGGLAVASTGAIGGGCNTCQAPSAPVCAPANACYPAASYSYGYSTQQMPSARYRTQSVASTQYYPAASYTGYTADTYGSYSTTEGYSTPYGYDRY